MDRERLLIVSPYPPPADGIGEHTRALSREWSKTYEIHILTTGRGGVEHAEIEGRPIRIWRVLSRNRNHIRTCIWNIAPTWGYIQYTISSYGTSLSGVHTAAQELRRGAVPFAVGYHEPSREPGALPVIGKRIYRNMLKKSNKTLVFSHNGAASLEKLGGRGVEVVPHGTRTIQIDGAAVAAVQTGFEKPFALAFGFIHPDKGTKHFIEAVAQLQHEGMGIVGVVAGEVRERRGIFKVKEIGDRKHLEALRKLSADLQADIRFVGRVAEGEVAAYLQAAAVNVLAYTNGTQSGVASLITGAGRGAVASNLSGLREQLQDGALYCSPGDSASLAAVLREALQRPVMQALDAAAGRLQAANRYAEVAQRIEDIARA